ARGVGVAVESQSALLLLWPMAGEAVLDEKRADVAGELDSPVRRRRKVRGQGRAGKEAQEYRNSAHRGTGVGWDCFSVPRKVAHALTVSFTASISARPDFRDGRGIGCAWPFASIVRHRSTYSPAVRPDKSVAQCALASRIGHVFGRPDLSKPMVLSGIASFGSLPPQFSGGPRIVASVHGAFVK